MRKYYCLPVIFLAGITTLTGCHRASDSEKSTDVISVSTQSLTFEQERYIQASNKQVAELTKRIAVYVDKLWEDLIGIRDTANQGAYLIYSKYPYPREGYADNDHSAGKKQIDIYRNMIYGLNDYHIPPITGYDVLTDFQHVVLSQDWHLKDGIYFLYDPSKGQDKVEVLDRLQKITTRFERVQVVIQRTLTFDYSQVEPQCQSVITTLRHQLTQAKLETDAALSTLAVVKKYVMGYPDW